MFTSVIMIFILLAVGLAALLVSATGRAGSGGSQLPPQRRAWLAATGLIAWAGAYYFYQHPPEGQPGTFTSSSFGSSPAAGDPAVSLREQAASRPAANEVPVLADGTSTLSPSAAAMEAQADEAIQPALEEKLVEVTAAPSVVARPALGQSFSSAAKVAPLQRIDSAALSSSGTATAALPALPRSGGNAPYSASSNPRRAARAYRAPTPRVARSSNSRGTTIHVLNSLGAGQSEERLTLAIEGRPLANLAINSAKPSVHVPLVLPRPGFLHYTLTGSTLENGYRRVAGSGCIEMLNQSSFEVRRTEDGSNLYLQRVATRHYR